MHFEEDIYIFDSDSSDTFSYSDNSISSNEEKSSWISSQCSNPSSVTLSDYESDDYDDLFTVRVVDNFDTTMSSKQKATCMTRHEFLSALKTKSEDIPLYIMSLYTTPTSSREDDFVTGMTGKPTYKFVVRIPSIEIYVTIRSANRILREANKQWYALPLYHGKRRRIGNTMGFYGSSMNHGQAPGFKVYKLYTEAEAKRIKEYSDVKETFEDYYITLDDLKISGGVDNRNVNARLSDILQLDTLTKRESETESASIYDDNVSVSETESASIYDDNVYVSETESASIYDDNDNDERSLSGDIDDRSNTFSESDEGTDSTTSHMSTWRESEDRIIYEGTDWYQYRTVSITDICFSENSNVVYTGTLDNYICSIDTSYDMGRPYKCYKLTEIFSHPSTRDQFPELTRINGDNYNLIPYHLAGGIFSYGFERIYLCAYESNINKSFVFSMKWENHARRPHLLLHTGLSGKVTAFNVHTKDDNTYLFAGTENGMLYSIREKNRLEENRSDSDIDTIHQQYHVFSHGEQINNIVFDSDHVYVSTSHRNKPIIRLNLRSAEANRRLGDVIVKYNTDIPITGSIEVYGNTLYASTDFSIVEHNINNPRAQGVVNEILDRTHRGTPIKLHRYLHYLLEYYSTGSNTTVHIRNLRDRIGDTIIIPEPVSKIICNNDYIYYVMDAKKIKRIPFPTF